MDKPKIYVYCLPAPGWRPGDVIGYAVAEDGEGLASHLSSGEGYARHDMGITGTWKHDAYAAKYPDGYDLVWVDDVDACPELLAAIEKNHALKAESEAAT